MIDGRAFRISEPFFIIIRFRIYPFLASFHSPWQQVIGLCERYAGADAKVTKVSLLLLKAARVLTSLFQWTSDVSDRLAFAEVLASDEVFISPMRETYEMLGEDPARTTTVEQYLQEYYSNILKKLKEVGAESRQTDYYL